MPESTVYPGVQCYISWCTDLYRCLSYQPAQKISHVPRLNSDLLASNAHSLFLFLSLSLQAGKKKKNWILENPTRRR